MSVNRKKIAKNAIMLYIRMGIVLVVSLYTARVVLQQLGASDYGLQNVVGGVVTMLNFMSGALTSGVQRFYNVHKAKNDYEAISKVYTSSLVVMLGFALILLIFAETVGLWFLNYKMNIPADRMVAANWVYQFAIISTILGIAAVPYNAMFVAHEDFNIYAYLSIGLALGNLGIAFLLQTSTFDKLIFYSTMMCLLMLLYYSSFFIITRIKYKKIRLKPHRDKEVFRSLLSFSGWNILGTSMFMVGTQGINIILNIFFGTVVNAARGIAVQISHKVDDFIKNVQTATDPQIVQSYARGEMNAVQSLVDDNFRWNFSLYWLIALPILFEIDYILKIWLSEVPPYTALFSIIIILRSLLKCFERPVNTLNYAIGDMRSINLFATASVLITTVLMVICFIFGFPPYWAFVWDNISICACILFYMSRARVHHAFSFRHFFKTILIPITIVIIVSVGGTYILRLLPMSGLLELFYTLLVTTTLTNVLVFYILLTPNNRESVKSFVSSKVHNPFKRGH